MIRVVAILPQTPGVGQTVAVQNYLRLLLAIDQEGRDPSQPAGTEHQTDDAYTTAILAAIEASKTTLMGHLDTLAIECGLITGSR